MISEKKVCIEIEILAGTSKVWNTLTNSDLVKRWMSDAEIEINSDWKEGSPLVIRGNVNGKYEYKGIILKAEPEIILQYTSWTQISRLADIPENYSLVEFKLTPKQNRTLLTLTHSNLIAKAAYEHSNFYWTSALQVMKRIIES